MSENKNMKVRVRALFHRLQINKNIKFQTHILWKRGQNKIQSKMVNHEKGFSVFQQELSLDFNLLYNEAKGQFDDKNTQIVAIIMYDGRTKSGGYAKYNIAQIINDNLDGKVVTIPLKQCPDPKAHVEVTFYCEYLQQQGDAVSVINGGDRETDISRVNFHDDKISLEIDRINNTIAKLADLAKSVNAKQRGNVGQGAEQAKKIQILESEKQVLIGNTKKLQAQIATKQKESNDRLKADQKIISDLQRQLSKKEKDYKIIEFGHQDEQKRYKEELAKKQKQLYKYKTLYEDTLAEIKQDKNSQMRASMGFGRMEIDDALDIPKFQTSKEDSDQEQEKPKHQKEVAALKAQNNQLQTSLANMSYKLAQLFNSAYEYGGAKLLDHLQTSIGLTQF